MEGKRALGLQRPWRKMERCQWVMQWKVAPSHGFQLTHLAQREWMGANEFYQSVQKQLDCQVNEHHLVAKSRERFIYAGFQTHISTLEQRTRPKCCSGARSGSCPSSKKDLQPHGLVPLHALPEQDKQSAPDRRVVQPRGNQRFCQEPLKGKGEKC